MSTGSTGSNESLFRKYQLFTTPGNYSVKIPYNTTNTKVICISASRSEGQYYIRIVPPSDPRRGQPEYVTTMRGQAGSTVWSDNFPAVPGTSYNVVVGARGDMFESSIPQTTSSFGDGISNIVVNTSSQATVPAQTRIGESGTLFYSEVILDQRGQVVDHISTKITQTLRAGAYGGNSTIAGPLISQIGTLVPPNIDIVRSPSDWVRSGPGAVYVEFTSTTPFVDNPLIASNTVTTFAGGNGPGLDDGGMIATYDASGITRDPVNNVLYLATPRHNQIRRLVQNNGVWESSILAGSDVYDPATSSFTAGHVDGVGTSARFNRPNDVYYWGNYVYVADTKNHAIRKIRRSDGSVATYAGGNGPGLINGPADIAKFDSPESLTVGSDGAVYVADTGNNCIRKIYNGVVSTYEANFARPTKICFGANGKLYVTGSQGVKLLL